MQRGVGHTRRRHPRCPDCGYNLVAAVAAAPAQLVCPECGARLDPGDLIIEPAPGDWTPARGLLAAVLHLGWRAAAAAFSFGLVLIALELLSGSVTGLWLAAAIIPAAGMLITLLTGYVIGRTMVHRLAERAGFEGGALTVLAIIFAWPAFFAGAVLTSLVMPITIASSAGIAAMAALVAIVPIVKITLLDE